MKFYVSLIDRLSTQHEALPVIISSVDENHLLTRPQRDKWHIKDNIAHLARYQQIFSNRLHKMLHSNIYFERYKAEEDPEFEKLRSLDIVELMEILNTDRKNLINFLTGLKDHDLARSATHKKYGQMNMLQWTEFFLLHEAHHIFTIFQLAHDTELKSLKISDE